MLVVAAAAAVGTAAIWFDEAFPIVALELEMVRGDALAEAESLAGELGWGTADFRHASSFGQQDREIQAYIEMDVGGTEGWLEIVDSGIYRPYLWTVRQFEEQTTREAEVRFTPAGEPWGFELTLGEDEPGASLPVEAARSVAEEGTPRWNVDLAAWRPVSASLEDRPGGRRDHTFVYQRDDDRFGDARYRLRLTVLGDRLGEVTRYVEVPQAFTRRYEEMRSANNLIALVAGVVYGLFYIVIGWGVGIFLLVRRRALSWRMPVLWGAVTAALVAGTALNQLPTSWMGYDTALPAGGFLAQQVLVAVMVLVGTLLYASLAYAAGEGLTRRAFPGEIQLWRLWSRGVANSDAALGRTLGGYLFAAFFIAYIVGFYLFATRVLGWTLFADSVVDPDVLSTPLPWLSAVGTSLLAGFSEEAIFRAVPLAAAVWVSSRYGRRNLVVGAVLLLQALVFASAHANYPQQPAYARVVELFLPAVALGVVFLRWGFLPVVVAHFLYDLAWFSLPLFATAPGEALVTKGIILLAGVTPLGVVIVARRRWGRAVEPDPAALNRAWSPGDEPEAAETVASAGRTAAVPTATAGEASAVHTPPDVASPDAAPLDAAPADAPPVDTARAATRPLPLVLAAAVGVVLWAATTPFSADAPPLEIGRVDARAVAAEALRAEGVDVETWRLLARTGSDVSGGHRFVWETSDRETYHALLGDFLPAPHWRVRAARFEGAQEERAEEWLVIVGHDGEPVRVVHTLPESRPGRDLPEAEARALAVTAAADATGADPSSLEEISAEATRRPERSDWRFTFEAPSPVAVGDGGTRVEVEIAGDEVVDARPFVFLPEAWEREERAESSEKTIYAIAGGLLLGLLGLGALGLAIVRWARGDFPSRVFVWTLVGVTGWTLAEFVNGWSALMAGFGTSQPLGTQIATAVVGALFGALLLGAALGLLAGLGHSVVPPGPLPERAPWTGLAAGLLAAGLLAALGSLRAAGEPLWPSHGAADDLLPFLGVMGSALIGYFTAVVAALVAVGLLGSLAERRGEGAVVLGAMIVGMALAAVTPEMPAWTLALEGAVAGAALWGLTLLARRVHGAVVPGVVAGFAVLAQVAAAARPGFSGHTAAALVAAVLVLAAGIQWSRHLAERPGPVKVP